MNARDVTTAPPIPRKGLVSLLVAQFMGAANDNILKTLLSFAVVRGIWEGKLGEGGQGLIALCLFVPFIIFSGWAGPLSDKYSKRTIAVSMKCCEVPLALMGGLGFVTGTFWLTALAMVLLAIQSTFFAPSKYGMIPEIVNEQDVSKANGLLNMFTNIAVIVGMLIAGFLSDSINTNNNGQNSLWFPLIAMVGVSLIGLIAILWLPKLQAINPERSLPLNGFASYASSVREMSKTPLLRAAIAWANFYFIATVALLIVTELGVLLDVSDSIVSYMLAGLGVSVGVGSILSGYISKGHINVRISRYSAFAMVISLFGLGVLPPSLGFMSVGLFVVGITAGMYAVPIQSLLQVLSTPERRGQILATTNAMSFSFMAIASLLYWIGRPLFGDAPQHIFIVCSVVAILCWFLTLKLHIAVVKHEQ